MPVKINLEKWIEENKAYFLPPVCNKMMHEDGQLKVFCVGGPNFRKDYHIEEGEELFCMVKGDMCLKIIEQGQHKDIPIREGEIFLLPARVPHSPQRKAGTVGLVLERERALDETDGLRFYTEQEGRPTLESLYEEWFYCKDLGVALRPVIERFLASEQYKTGKPIPGTIPSKPPLLPDSRVKTESPFHLGSWIDENKEAIDSAGYKTPFKDGHQFEVRVYGKGENSDQCDDEETFIWQLRGTSLVLVGETQYDLQEGDTLLIEAGKQYSATRPSGSVALIAYQDAKRKKL